MLNEKMQKALNKQLNAEAYSGYLYLAMSAYCESINLRGMAKWLGLQAREEFYHSARFYNFILERGGRVELTAIDAPPGEWSAPLALFEAVLEHEQKVTGLINDLVNLAAEEKDHASSIFLQWFVSEQVEEEAAADDVVQRLKLAGSEGPGLFMIDTELAQRAITPAVAASMVGDPPVE